MVEFIVQKLKESAFGCLAASQLGTDINKRPVWARVLTKSGGLKSFCLDHTHKVRWVSEGSGRVELVNIEVPLAAKVDSSPSQVPCVAM